MELQCITGTDSHRSINIRTTRAQKAVQAWTGSTTDDPIKGEPARAPPTNIVEMTEVLEWYTRQPQRTKKTLPTGQNIGF